MLKIIDREGARPVAEMRALFEKGVCDTGGVYARQFSNLTWDEKTDGYANENTHRHWIGFAIGMRTARMEADAKIPQGLALIRQMVNTLDAIMDSGAISGEAYREHYDAATAALNEAHRIFALPMLTAPAPAGKPTTPAAVDAAGDAICTRATGSTPESCGCVACMAERGTGTHASPDE